MNPHKMDFIGDIHGHANVLHALLKLLDYREIDGFYQHPERTVVFLGDFIDRGPDQREVFRIARGMCEGGSARAIMGNHEFNAIGWVTRNEVGHFLRPHDAVHHAQHERFLEQFGENSQAHRDAIEWFWSLPILIDAPLFRAVHACWHAPSISTLRSGCLDEAARMTRDGFKATHHKGTALNDAMEVVLKGPEKALPAGVSFHDKSGHERREARIKWWDPQATTFRTAALGMDGRESELPADAIGDDYRYYDDVPVFFGHYGLQGEPEIVAPNAVCLDYSVAKNGKLVAYRMTGDELQMAGLIHVDA